MNGYPVVNIETAATELNRLHGDIEGKMRSTVQDAIRAGEILSQVKEKVSHGTFLAWVAANVAFDERTVRRYMQVFEYRDKTDSVSDLQEAYRQVESLEAQARRSEEEQARNRVDIFVKTGKKPDGWRRGTDDNIAKEEKNRAEKIAKMQSEMRREHEQKAKILESEREEINRMADRVISGFTRESQAIRARTEWKDKIRLSHEGKADPFLDAIMEYLGTLDSDSRRIESCHNIIKICKGIANQLQVGK